MCKGITEKRGSVLTLFVNRKLFKLLYRTGNKVESSIPRLRKNCRRIVG